MSYPQILHHGAIAGVTGSCHQLQMDAEHGLLIDCGLFQGAEVSPEGRAGANNLAIDFPLTGINALVATHVHIDHVGHIPYLLATGFSGPILCSEPSAKLLPIVLEDAFKLGFSRDQQQVERYLQLLERRIIALPYDSWFTLWWIARNSWLPFACSALGISLAPPMSRSILYYRQTGASQCVVFSGDLGTPHSPLLPAPAAPECADILVIESTDGDRLHEDRRSRRQRLERVIEQALAGTVLIPAFSIGRAQELLYELEDILHAHSSTPIGGGGKVSEGGPIDWHNLPIILDSPLASRFTWVYREMEPFWDVEALARVREGRKPLSFANLLTVDSHQAHLAMVRRLAETAQPAIVVAAGGMCAGARIVGYLKAMLHDPRHDVLFVGCQAQGTPGRAIQAHGPRGGYVELDEVRYKIGARVSIISGYSAHADQQGLVSFVT